MLRDSGQSVNLVVKRRVVLPAPPEPQNIRVTLLRNKKKDGEHKYSGLFLFQCAGGGGITEA